MKKASIFFCLLIISFLLINSVLAIDLAQTTEKASGFIESANSFCSSNEVIISRIFGAECTGDLSFVLAIVLWFVFLMLFFDGIATFTPFSKWVSFVIALASVMILATLGHFAIISNFITELITTPKGLVILVGSLLVFLILYALTRGWRIAEKKKIEEMKLRMNQRIVNRTGEAISKSFRD